MITIDYRDRRPIYQQLISNIEDLAARGLMPPNTQLPSVRALALELAINPNTISRAYVELERRGVIYSVPGKGTFISDNSSKIKEARSEEISAQLQDLIHQAQQIGITKEELKEQIEKFYTETEVDHND